MKGVRIVKTAVENFLKQPGYVIITRETSDKVLDSYHFNVLFISVSKLLNLRRCEYVPE